MKKLYWRPPGVSRAALMLITGVAVVSLLAVTHFPQVKQQPWSGEKLAAARLARDSMAAIKREKVRRAIPIDSRFDPAGTGVIGESITPVTSNTGYLDAKLTSANPNFAAVIVHLLKQAEVGKDDLVAVGVSGSFPALNVSTYAALATLGATPLIIASTASSEFGANHVGYLWLDMEATLEKHHLIEFRSLAASLGGIDDRGVGMSDTGRELLREAIARSGAVRIEADSLTHAIDERMALYERRAGERPIRAYINVGGGSASVGTHVGKKQFGPGLNRSPPSGEDMADSVMLRFAKRGVPVIHLSSMKVLAERYGLPYDPRTEMPIGQGNVYERTEPNRWLAAGGVLAILLSMLAFIRMDLGARVLRLTPRAPKGHPEQMI
ncbi:MAG: poly-gamma-glutamate system protein [Polyangiaceae bacterium]|nr:poly-gamma-glutamate system protein [Polyangiaceae bacterium]MCW5790517.1 poly-gamma-glutamate system protein [Polyangiaceae bacterium]